MIGYVTLGTNDLKRAISFYDGLLEVLGGKRFMEGEAYMSWAISPDTPSIFVTQPFDGNSASVGNGMMVGLQASSREQVDAVYNKAIELGAKDEGPAGEREFEPGFYVGYFRDLDGNKLSVFYFAADK